MTLSLTFSQSFLEQNVSVQLKKNAIFSNFLLFRNKAKNAVCSGKNAGNKLKCGISRTIAGRLTPMLLKDLNFVKVHTTKVMEQGKGAI